MVGLDVTHEAGAGSEEVARMRETGRVGEVAAELVTFFAAGYEKVFGFPAPPIHDAVAVAAVLEPEILQTRRMRVDVECEGDLTRGETVCDVYGVTGAEPNAEVAVGLDRGRFFDTLFGALGRL
jgi:purine nucleosidase/pyrimidine-specific ribonucleoside hydrolase